MPREMFPFASMLVSLYHTIPQMVILTIACLWTRSWDPDLVGMAAALLGFAIVLLFGTALGLMFSVFNVLFRDFGRIVQTFLNVLPFAVPMMYPYSMVTERFGTGWPHDLVLANPLAEAVLLIQRGFWWTDDDQRALRRSRSRPTSGSAGFIMLGHLRRPPGVRAVGVQPARGEGPGAPDMTTLDHPVSPAAPAPPTRSPRSSSTGCRRSSRSSTSAP